MSKDAKKNKYFLDYFFLFYFVFSQFNRSLLRIHQSKPTLASYSSAPVVIIDAGHGGMDGGAIGVDGQIEKEINLSIALKLDTMLRAYGFQTIMTRDSDVSIHSPDAKTVRQQKTSDLKNRLKLLEDTSSGILISIHQNKYSQSSAHGTQVFYGKNCPESKELAEMLQKTITAIFSRKIHGKSRRQQRIFISYIRPQNRRYGRCGFYQCGRSR